MPSLLANIRQRVGHRVGRFRATRRERDELVSIAIEQVAEAVDPRFRLVRGYARKLRPAVEHMLVYAENVCARLPGPMEFSRRSWSSDATVRALFPSPEQLRRVFSRNQAIVDFFDRHQDPEVQYAYAVLGMAKHEKTVFGMQQEGDIIRREVAQVNVSFSEHRITHPALDEQSLRLNLRERALNEFIAQALARVTAMKSRREGLRESRALLEVQMRVLQREAGGLTGILRREGDAEAEMAELRARLDTVSAECSQIKESLGTLDAALMQLASLLSRPEELIQVNPITLHLDRLNRRQPTGHPITLAEVVFRGAVKRVGVLAKFPRSELLPKEDFLRQVNRYLS